MTVFATPTLRDRAINGAIRAGKFPESRRGHYEALYAQDPTEALAQIGQMVPALPPVLPDAQRSDGGVPVYPSPGGGYARATSDAGEDGYEQAWLNPTERDRIAAAEDGRQHSRIVNE